MNTVTSASTTFTTPPDDVAHIAMFAPGEWGALFETWTPKRAYCGAQRPPRPDCDDLPMCPECRLLSTTYV